MSEGPTWIITDPAKPYPDGRFDDPAIPDASTPVWASDMGMTPPPASQREPTPEQIADAARKSLDNLRILFRSWHYVDGGGWCYTTNDDLLDLLSLRDLLLGLKPPDPPLGIADMKYFQAEYDERAAAIVEAAADAADDIATVMRHWTFSAISDLPNLRALDALLTPPAPKWTATEAE